MVKHLLAALTRFRVGLLELLGAGTIVAGTAQFSERAALIVAGVFVLAKSFELDLRRGGDGGP